MHDAEAVRRLVAGYATHYDHGELDAVVALYADDARMVFGTKGSAEGLEAIADRLRTGWAPGRRHVNAISAVGPAGSDGPVDPAGERWAVTDWVMYRDRDVSSVGRYTDRIRDGRFVERRIRYDIPGELPSAGPDEEPSMTWPTDPADAIRQTLARYGQLADDRRIDEVADLFTVDCVFEVRGKAWQGRAEITARGGTGPDPGSRTKHVTVNPLIEVADDATSADVRTDFLYFVAPEAGPWRLSSTGRYHDRHVLDGDRWRIAERRVKID